MLSDKSKDVVKLVNESGTKAVYAPTLEDIANELRKEMQPKDIVLSIGAGNITHLADYFEDLKPRKK